MSIGNFSEDLVNKEGMITVLCSLVFPFILAQKCCYPFGNPNGTQGTVLFLWPYLLFLKNNENARMMALKGTISTYYKERPDVFKILADFPIFHSSSKFLRISSKELPQFHLPIQKQRRCVRRHRRPKAVLRKLQKILGSIQAHF